MSDFQNKVTVPLKHSLIIEKGLIFVIGSGEDPSQNNVDNLNNVRRDASRNFGNKKKAYLKAKIEELETNSKINNIRDFYRRINDFKKGYQPRTFIVKDEKGDLVADSHSIMTRWRKYFS